MRVKRPFEICFLADPSFSSQIPKSFILIPVEFTTFIVEPVASLAVHITVSVTIPVPEPAVSRDLIFAENLILPEILNTQLVSHTLTPKVKTIETVPKSSQSLESLSPILLPDSVIISIIIKLPPKIGDTQLTSCTLNHNLNIIEALSEDFWSLLSQFFSLQLECIIIFRSFSPANLHRRLFRTLLQPDLESIFVLSAPPGVSRLSPIALAPTLQLGTERITPSPANPHRRPAKVWNPKLDPKGISTISVSQLSLHPSPIVIQLGDSPPNLHRARIHPNDILDSPPSPRRSLIVIDPSDICLPECSSAPTHPGLLKGALSHISPLFSDRKFENDLPLRLHCCDEMLAFQFCSPPITWTRKALQNKKSKQKFREKITKNRKTRKKKRC